MKTGQVELEQAEKVWQEQVQQLRSYVDNFWEMGYITSEVLKKAYYGESTLSKFARQVGILPINLYRYARVYNEIPKDIKNKFSKILSFCFFEKLIDLDISKKNYEEYLDKAINEGYSVAEFGRFLSGTLAGTFDEPLKPVVLRFPGELRPTIDKIFDMLAQQEGIDPDIDYKKNMKILTAFVIACKDYLEGAVRQDE